MALSLWLHRIDDILIILHSLQHFVYLNDELKNAWAIQAISLEEIDQITWQSSDSVGSVTFCGH